jgi:hypothetical protein
MPGLVVQQSASVTCVHGGKAQPLAINARVLVSGVPVICLPSPWMLVGCPMPAPSAGNGPCVSATWTTGSTRVLSMGQPLVIQGGTATCLPTGVPLVVTATQTRVSAI